MRVRAVRDSFVVVSFAEVPQAHLVEIVQAERAREGIGEHEVARGGGGDDVSEVEFEEVGGADYGFGVDVADYCLNSKSAF
jgi:hypothetical protein